MDDATPRKAHIWARDPHDYYVEPEFCSRRLFAVEKFDGAIVDPACGSGRIVRSAADAGLLARGYDVVHRSTQCDSVQDFLTDAWEDRGVTDNIVSNPPFKHCDHRSGFAFIRRALERTGKKVALLLPADFDCSDRNGRFLESTPLRKKLIITPRPSMPPGAVIEAGQKPGNGLKNFAWFIWLSGFDGKAEIGWLRRDAA